MEKRKLVMISSCGAAVKRLADTHKSTKITSLVCGRHFLSDTSRSRLYSQKNGWTIPEETPCAYVCIGVERRVGTFVTLSIYAQLGILDWQDRANMKNKKYSMSRVE